MSDTTTAAVVTRDGVQGRIAGPAQLSDAGDPVVPVAFEDGCQIYVPSELLLQQSDGSFKIMFDLGQLERRQAEREQIQSEAAARRATDRTTSISDLNATRELDVRDGDRIDRLDRLDERAEGDVVLPVVEETVDIGKRQVETGRVRVRKLVHEREELVDEPLLREEVQVERVPVNQMIDRPVAARQEGDTLIVPVIEEVLVVEKRLMLKEELRITRHTTTERANQRVTLRSEEVQVERVAPQERERGGTDIAKE